MANRYWVGGTGTWNTTSTTNWSANSGGASGATVPTAADSVFFDQASTYTVTMTGALNCLDITASAGTVTFTSTGTLAAAGSMSLISSTVWSATGTVTFSATTTGQTITTNGVTLTPAITFNGVGGGWTLGSALTIGATAATTLTNGALALGGFTLTTGIFSSSNSNTRSIAFGIGNIVLATTSAGATNLAMTTITGFTYTGTGGFTAAADITRIFNFGTGAGVTSTNLVNLTFTGSGTAVQSIGTTGFFNKIDFGTTAFTLPATSLTLNALTLSSGGTFTGLTATMGGTGTVTTAGKTIAAFTVNSTGTVTMSGALGCTTYTQTAGTVDFATNNLTCSSTATYTGGTLSNIGTLTCTTFTVNGSSLTLNSGTVTPSTSFVVTTGSFTLGASATLSAVPTFTQTAGSVTFSRSYALTATGTYTLTAGTLDLGGFTLTTGVFSSTGTGVRSIAFGTGNIVLATTTTATLNLDIRTATNFTATGTGGFTAAADITRSFSCATTAGAIANGVNLTFTGSGTAVQTITSTGFFNKIDFGTTAFDPGTTSLTVNSLTLSSGGAYTGLTITTAGTGTFTPNGRPIVTLTINSTGTTTLAGAVTFTTATAVTTLTAGTLDLAGYTLTTGTFSSTNSNTRSIAFGTGNIVLATTTAGATNLNMGIAIGFSLTGTGGFTAAADITRTFSCASSSGTISNGVNLTFTGSGTAVQTITSTGFFNKVDFGTTAFNPGTTSLTFGSLTLSSGGTFTGLTAIFGGTGTFTPNGKPIVEMTVNCPGGTTTLAGAVTFTTATVATTLNNGTLDLAGYTLTTGTFSSSLSNTRSIAFGTGNIVLATTTGSSTNLDMANATGFSVTGTGGFTAAADVIRIFVFGTTGGSSSSAPNLTLTGSGTAIARLTTSSWFNKLDFGTTAFTIAATSLNLNGLTLSSSGTFTNLTVTMVGTGTITGNSKTIPAITIDHTGTTTLASALTVSGTTTFGTSSTPTLALGSQTLTTGSFSSSGSGARTISGSGTISVGGDWTVTTGSGFAGTGYTIRMTKATTKTFAGGGGTYGTLIQNGAGALTISGSNSFADIQAA